MGTCESSQVPKTYDVNTHPEHVHHIISNNKSKKSLNSETKPNNTSTNKTDNTTNCHYRAFKEDMSRQVKLEHYQPQEFPLIPVISTDTHLLTNESWKKISDREYEDAETQSGKVKGAIFFYNTFFKLLFDKSTDFRTKFPTVISQASVMSKVIAICLSIEYNKLDLQTTQLKELGLKHRYLVQDPWQFGIYATTIHSALKICLDTDATPQVMTAWLNVLAFILRTMLPVAITDDHIRMYAGATNAATLVNDEDQQNIQRNSEYKSMRSDLISGGLKKSSLHNNKDKDVNFSVADDDLDDAKTLNQKLKDKSKDGKTDTGRTESSKNTNLPDLKHTTPKGDPSSKSNMTNSIVTSQMSLIPANATTPTKSNKTLA